MVRLWDETQGARGYDLQAKPTWAEQSQLVRALDGTQFATVAWVDGRYCEVPVVNGRAGEY